VNITTVGQDTMIMVYATFYSYSWSNMNITTPTATFTSPRGTFNVTYDGDQSSIYQNYW
jgi:hypothetical protein